MGGAVECDESKPRSGAVGYCRPPAEHQFKKGVSGNPKGRPRKHKPQVSSGLPSVAELVLAEAYRPITLKENNETVTMPMIQAVLRSLGVAAVKGSHRAQLAITGLVQAVEQRTLDERHAFMEGVMEYKNSWQEIFERCDREGKPRPEPIPHPDDIAINGRTGEVTFNGPFDEIEKSHWDGLLEMKTEAVETIEEWKKRARRSKNKANLERLIEVEQRIIDRADRFLPDEQTRRRPGFNIHEWRERQERLQALRDKWRKSQAQEG